MRSNRLPIYALVSPPLADLCTLEKVVSLCNIPLWRTYKLILWGHLLASDPDLYDDKTLLSLWCIELYDRVFLLPWYRQVLLTQFLWVCRVPDLEDAEASVELPWTPDWVREWGIWVVSFWWCTIDYMICCWHELTWWLMMQADDSLPTVLTYGVKGPHTRSREVWGRGVDSSPATAY